MSSSYYVSKTKQKKETRYLELEKLDGYKVNPKIKPFSNKSNKKTYKIIFIS